MPDVLNSLESSGKSICMDLSRRPELEYLSPLVAELRRNAPDVRWIVVGAVARDLQLHFKHGVRIARATEDVDFAVGVEDWTHFQDFRQALLSSGNFRPVGDDKHIFRFRDGTRVDVIPFGGVENANAIVEWPPDGNPQMNVLGFSALSATAEEFLLPADEPILVPKIPMILLLKFLAWQDRSKIRPGVDASDIFLMLSSYAGLDNSDALYGPHADLLDDPDFDYENAGAVIAGRDLRQTLADGSADARTIAERLESLITAELEPEEPGLLLQQAPTGQLELFERLLRGFLRGLSGKD